MGISEAVDDVRSRLNAAADRSGRDPGAVRLIAVTKLVDASRVRDCIAAGITDIGENRVQEARAKREDITVPVFWHLLGHLQSNKTAPAAQLFDAIHSIDDVRTAQALAEHRHNDRDPIAALIQVDLTQIPGRHGLREIETFEMVRSVAGLPGVHLMGLMTVAPPVSDPEEARPYFIRLRQLRDAVEHRTGWPLPHLSMGMSDDFEVAVEEGATMVRIGRALFGARP